VALTANSFFAAMMILPVDRNTAGQFPTRR